MRETKCFLIVLLCIFVVSCSDTSRRHDIVILNARVMDPETGLDAIRNIGVTDQVIVDISTKPLSGLREIDATNLVAAPGFIDHHAHGQDLYAVRLKLRDGVTSQLDLEAGAYPVAQYYENREGKWPVNYGASASHLYARMKVLDGVSARGAGVSTNVTLRTVPTGNQWARARATDEQSASIVTLIEDGLKEGALGIGIPVGYYAHVDGKQIEVLGSLAAKYNTFITSHVRYMSLQQPSGYLGVQEMLSIAAAHDVPLLIHHIVSTSIGKTEDVLKLLEVARANGVDVMGEVYPYTKASSVISANYLDEGFTKRLNINYSDIVWAQTGEVLTEQSFHKYRNEQPGGMFIMQHIKRKDMIRALQNKNVFLGSDGMPFTDRSGKVINPKSPDGVGRGHPRGAGAYAKLLRLVREEQVLPLMSAIEKMTLMPAKFIENDDPSMKRRGRLQIGSYADITIFNPQTVREMSEFKIGENSLPSDGIPYVIVNGALVVDNGKIVSGANPGMEIRRGIAQ